MASRLQIRRDSAANWASANPVLAQGELGVELDTNKFKVGNGTSDWNSLPYLISTSDYISGVPSSVDNEIALFSGTGGKTLKRATTSGVLKASSGVLSAATAGTDYVAPGTSSTFTAAQAFNGQVTLKEVKDTVFTITDTAGFQIDPANGSIQTVTLGASRTPAATNFEAGQCVLLGIDDGAAYSITWTTVAPTWVKAGGTASAPTLATTGYTWILLWKVGTTIYASEVGKP